MRYITTTADTHLTNSDGYGVLNNDGVNDFLEIRSKAVEEVITTTKELDGHMLVPGDFLDDRMQDSHTAYFSSKLVRMMFELRFVILMEGNHGFIEKSGGLYSSISHWKHLASDSIRIVTYPKVERRDNIAYHCIPAVFDIGYNFESIVEKLYASSKKSDQYSILALHGPIVGARFESGKKNNSGISFEHIKNVSRKYDYVVCGDLHKYQMIMDRVWYCGAPIQSSLKDKGQKRGYQIIDLENKTVEFVRINGPRFVEIDWNADDDMPHVLRDPSEYASKFANAVVVVNITGNSKGVESVDIAELKRRIVDAGAIRAFDNVSLIETKDRAQALTSDMSSDEMVQRYAQHMKDQLPASMDDVVKVGARLMRGN